MIVSTVRACLALQQHYGFDFPTFAMFSLCNSEKLRLYFDHRGSSNSHFSEPLGEALVSLPEIHIENPKIEVPNTLRPLFNIIWNAFGRLSCDMFDSLGDWIGVG
jgi:hypothetical protein